MKELIIDLKALEIIISKKMTFTEKGSIEMAWAVHKAIEILEGSAPKVVGKGLYECKCGRRVNKDQDMFCASCAKRIQWDKIDF